MITQERLKELLHYNPETGIFTNRVSRSNVKAGDVAGAVRPNGYIHIRIDKKYYLSHRLAWMFVHGNFPEWEVDHINRVRHDNRITNLRAAHPQQNQKNTKTRTDNTSGIKGVYWDARSNIWHAEIMTGRKKCYLGCHKDLVEVVARRLAGEQSLGWHDMDSNTPAFKFMQKILLKE